MGKIIISTGSSIAALSIPFIASAQSITSVTTLISALINYSIGILIGVAIIAFFLGLIKYLFKSTGDATEKGKAAKLMIYGIIAIAVMLSIYGLVRLLQNTFGVGNGAAVPPPSIGQLQINQGR